MKHSNVLVVGGSGFIGRHLVASLAAAGLRVTVPSRRRERAKHLILLPTVDVVQADIMAPGVLERLSAGKDAVYNLVGILHGRRGRGDERGPNDYGPDFARMHVELPQAIVAACRANGVRRLLHISALGASPDAPSEYLRSKSIGERALFAADDLEVTVFRPSVVFGPEDQFLNRFAAFTRWLPVFAVPSPEAMFQPVYVGDVARALHFALDEPDAAGQGLRAVRAAGLHDEGAGRVRVRSHRPAPHDHRPARAPLLYAGMDARAPARQAHDARQPALDAGAEHVQHAVSLPLRAAGPRGRRAGLSGAHRAARKLPAASLARAPLGP